MGSQKEEKDLKSLRKEVEVLRCELVNQGRDIDEIRKQSEDAEIRNIDISKEVKKDREDILVALEKELKERNYLSDQPVVNGVVIQLKELKKMQEDQMKVNKLEEDLEKTKADVINVMESSHRAALEAARQENTRQLKTKQKLEAVAEVLKRQLAEEKATVLKLKNENKDLMDDNSKLKNVNRTFVVKEDNLKTRLKRSYEENLKLKKEKDEAAVSAAAALQLECENKDCKVQNRQVHQANCEYRPVLCPGDKCGKMAAFRDIELHIQTCPGMDRDGIDDRFKIYNTIHNFIIPDELFEQGTGEIFLPDAADGPQPHLRSGGGDARDPSRLQEIRHRHCYHRLHQHAVLEGRRPPQPRQPGRLGLPHTCPAGRAAQGRRLG
jgi:hypothetical protein